MEWQTAETLPDVMSRPGRCIIRVEGWRHHDGATWSRQWIDIVHTSSETRWGFRQRDITRIEHDGDMDGIDAITHWMPATFPAVS